MLYKDFWKRIDNASSKIEGQESIDKFIVDEKFYQDKKPIVEIKDLSQRYKSNTRKKGWNVVFENVNFKIFEGDKLALIGANGSGKTTLVEIIAGFKKPTKGEVIKHFENIPESQKIGVQFQDLSFPRVLTVKDVIKFIIELDKSNLSEDEILNMVDVFELLPIINTKISKLSGGQQQRLNVILSLVNKPKLLFLDEFTTGLDIAIKNRIKNFINDYCEKNNITIVIISHDVVIMTEMASRAIIIGHGSILVDAPIEEVNKKFGNLSKLTNVYIK
ncbi:MAG: ATP-binding cassette domain-containing protein [Mycoplasmoidaceae bacterium]